MKYILWLLVIIVLISAGYMIMDYMGYYIEWKVPVIALVVLAPIAQAIKNFSERPEKMFKKNNNDGSKG